MTGDISQVGAALLNPIGGGMRHPYSKFFYLVASEITTRSHEMQAVNRTSDKQLADDISIADTLFLRMKGLLGRNTLPLGKGLWIRPCKGVHTFGMKFPIDVIFLDKGNRVISLEIALQPNRMTKVLPGATSVLELPAGILETSNTCIGDEVIIA